VVETYPLVKVLHKISEASKNAFRDAGKNSGIAFLACSIGKLLQSSNNCHKQRAKANASKRRSQGAVI
jgi:hypothetical protein